jgi:serine protease AprX
MKAIEESSSMYVSPDTLMGYGIPNMVIAHLLLSGVPISNFDVENNITLFPNPVSSNLNVVFYSTDYEQMKFQLYDINGKLVSDIDSIQRIVGMNFLQIGGFDTLKKGLYSLIINSDTHRFSKKIIKL